MNPKLVPMLTVVGVVVAGGVGGGLKFYLATPQPETRTMLELRDGGIADGQRIVLTCPERLTPRTKRRIRDTQGANTLRPKQSYARIARTALCFNPDAGNCWRPSDFAPRIADLEGTIVVPSLRRSVAGLDPDAGDDDGGEDAVDDSFQFDTTACEVTRCADFDAGDGSNFCARLSRLMMVTPPCVIPNCWVGDGGAWVDDAVVDCQFGGIYGLPDGGPRWRGCNVGPREFSSGSQCLPVECSVLAGDSPPDYL